MPNTASAKKRLRQDKVRQVHNRSIKRSMKTQIRKVNDALAAGDPAKTEEEFRLAVKRLDQTAAKGVIHRNVASRLKSRLSKKLKAAKSAG